jgi:hypothetical protein
MGWIMAIVTSGVPAWESNERLIGAGTGKGHQSSMPHRVLLWSVLTLLLLLLLQASRRC